MRVENRPIAVDESSYQIEIKNVGTIVQNVANVRNGLNTKNTHLKAPRVEQIFRLYDHLTKLVVAYGEMAKHDLVEFEQVGINIKKTDSEAK